ncbi:MAG: hypothetical protein AB7V45_08055 [Candidatus Krumholzibacteriia bacterium]
MKGLGMVALAALVGALGLALLGDRLGQGNLQEAPPLAAPVHEAAIELTADGMVPPKLRVPKDHELHLLVRAAPDAPEGILTIGGYPDPSVAVDIGPGSSREMVFLCDRPGDDFAFLLGGRVVGRLEVTGSHLEDGHQ